MKLRASLVFSMMMAMTLSFAQAPENWFNLDAKKDGVPGVSTERTYQELLTNRQGRTVIVAVLDSGVDAEHEDLQEVMWVNEDEIPNNGKDDDNNGYIDDIHGWNFIGGKDGKNINQDNLEVTRLYRKYKPKYENADVSKLSKKEKKEYRAFKKMEEEIEEKRGKMEQNLAIYTGIVNAMSTIKMTIGKDNITLEDIESLESDDEVASRAAMVVARVMDSETSFSDLEKQFKEAYDYFYNQANYYYNPDFDPRAKIVGDNYNDPNDRSYGNNDVKGPDAGHGTHVAGIIGAVRNNSIGIKGVADNVRIMSVRCVPDGDERDKDVANAIRYAVDNGASIINMSFGKGYAWDKDAVDEAVKYAKKKDVLLVHAAGNSSQDNDITNNFPNDDYNKKGWFKPKKAKNWIEVGALDWKDNEQLAAKFSNYGKNNVDIFAPGVDIYSTTPDQNYDSYNGTSMASPVVAGTAAILRSYFPTLTAEQVKEVIEKSAVKRNIQVKLPGSGQMTPFSNLSMTGGVINTYTAVKMAEKTKGKKKVKKGESGSGKDVVVP